MARIPFASAQSPEQLEIAARVAERRGGSLLNLDRLLLHSPPYAEGWNGFLGAVRGRLSLAPKLRELAICGVAVLNGAEYEFAQHAPEFLKAGGSRAQLNALHAFEAAAGDAALFDEVEMAAMALTIEMTRAVAVKDATFARVRDLLGDDRQVVELVGVVAAYNMVSRFLVALDIDPEAPVS